MIPLHGFFQDLANPDAVADGKMQGKNNRLPWSRKNGLETFPTDGTSSEFYNSIQKLMGVDGSGSAAANSDPTFQGGEYETDLPAFNQLRRLVAEQQDRSLASPDEITTPSIDIQPDQEKSIQLENAAKQNDVLSAKKIRPDVVEKAKDKTVDDTECVGNPFELYGGVEETTKNVSDEVLQPPVNGPDVDAFATEETPYSESATAVSLENAKTQGSVLSGSVQSDNFPGNGPRLDKANGFGVQLEMENGAVSESPSKITSTETESEMSRNLTAANPGTDRKMTAFGQQTSKVRAISYSDTPEKESDTQIPLSETNRVSKSPEGARLSHQVAGVASERPSKDVVSETASESGNSSSIENRSSQVAMDSSSARATNQFAESPSKDMVSATASESGNSTMVENRSSQVTMDSSSARATNQFAESPSKEVVSETASESGNSARVENRSSQVAMDSSSARATNQFAESPSKEVVSETASESENSARVERRSSQMAMGSLSARATNQFAESQSKGLVSEMGSDPENSTGVASRSLRPAMASPITQVVDSVAEIASKAMVTESASGGENPATVAAGAARTTAPLPSQGDLSAGPATSPALLNGESGFQTVEARGTKDAGETAPSSLSWRTIAAVETATSTPNQLTESDDGFDTSVPIGRGEETNKTEAPQSNEVTTRAEEREKVTISPNAALLDESGDVKLQSQKSSGEHQSEGNDRSHNSTQNHVDSKDEKADPNVAADRPSTSNSTEKEPQGKMKTIESFSFQPIEAKNEQKGAGETSLSQRQATAVSEFTKPVVDPTSDVGRSDGDQTFRPTVKTVSAFASKAKREKEGISTVTDRPVEEADSKGFLQTGPIQTRKNIKNFESSADRNMPQEEHLADRMKSETPASVPEEISVGDENQRRTDNFSDNIKSNGPDPARLQTSHDETMRSTPATANTGVSLTGQTAASNPRPSIPGDAFQSSVMEQVVRHTAVRSLKGRSEVQIQLKPEFLGNVRMNIATEKNQVLVRIVTDSATVKETIDSHVHQLKAELQNQGLTVDKFEVTVNSQADHHSGRDQSSQMQRHNASGNGQQADHGQDAHGERRGRGNHAHDELLQRNLNRRNGINHFA